MIILDCRSIELEEMGDICIDGSTAVTIQASALSTSQGLE